LRRHTLKQSFNYKSRSDHGIPWDSARVVYLYGGQ
jgi:hypothetical protein